uniref:CFEM domain-containing protein n=1 Tax=Mycena chlorophos TaxID=658473 RepID=A0ABQ0M1T0_MYCCL|nr:predicted protein [Mycena chlorophos]
MFSWQMLPLTVGLVFALTTTITPIPASPTTSSSSPYSCIDTCFNNATGDGTQGGCAGLAGQYECICAFPAMMQSFASCMSISCSLDNTTVQETLGNVQQVCASCTSDGCNSFNISATETIQAQSSSEPSSLCPTTVESATATTASGGVGASAFFSEGLGSCTASAGNSASSTSRTITVPAVSGAPTTNGTTSSVSVRCRPNSTLTGTTLTLVVAVFTGVFTGILA